MRSAFDIDGDAWAEFCREIAREVVLKYPAESERAQTRLFWYAAGSAYVPVPSEFGGVRLDPVPLVQPSLKRDADRDVARALYDARHRYPVVAV